MAYSQTLILFPFLFLSSVLLSTAAPVLDTDGSALQPGVAYYVLPVIRGRGGGLTPASRNNTCPLYTAQAAQEVENGTPLRIYPVNTAATAVEESTDANFVFTGASICVQSMVWTLSGLNGNRYVALNGVRGNPGASTLNNWFRIDRSGSDYKLVFCPGVCNVCRPACGELGIFIEGGRRWLGVSGSSFPVVFKKA